MGEEDSDAENQTKDLSGSVSGEPTSLGYNKESFLLFLRASDLGTQKASPLGLSCHFFLLTSMKLTSPVFFLNNKKKTVSFHALHCYDFGGVVCSVVACLALCHWVTQEPLPFPAVLLHSTHKLTFTAL